MSEHEDCHHCRAITPDQFRRLCEEFRSHEAGVQAELGDFLPQEPRLGPRKFALRAAIQDLGLCLHIDMDSLEEWFALLGVQHELREFLFPRAGGPGA